MISSENMALTLPNVHPKLRLVIHGLGLSSLGSALFLQTTVFTSILQNGYFRGIGHNPIILNSEIALTSVAIAYFGYLFICFVFCSNK
jgi:hypothetical protein